MKVWWQDMSQAELDFIMYVKKNDVVRPLYKLLVLVYNGVSRSDALKDILGGNYIVLVKEANMRGLIHYERGKPPELTEKGRGLAVVIDKCLRELSERERGGETSATG